MFRTARNKAPRRVLRTLRAGAVALLLAPVAWPADALALRLNGSLSWDFARTESRSGSVDMVQKGFGQTYRLGTTGTLVSHRIATWSAGAGWRRDLATFSGTPTAARDMRMTDLDLGMVLLPGTMPMTVNFRRSLVDNNSAGTVGQSSLNSTISLSTRVRMWDGEPLAITAHQATQDNGDSSHKSRLLSLSKRFRLSDRHMLNTGYQFTQFILPNGTDTGHAVSASTHSQWNDRLASTLYGNVTSRIANGPRRVAGRTLLTSNSYGGGVSYKRGAVLNANLSYAYTETPQDLNADIINHQLAGRASYRVDTKTDVDGNFTVRRLDLTTVTLDTMTANTGIRYRPAFGWAVGSRLGVAANTTSGAAATDRTSYTVAGFLSGRHDTVPVEARWGTDVGYHTTRGDFAQDRLTSTVYVNGTDKLIPYVQVIGEYRLTDIREGTGGSGLDPHSLEHGATVTATLDPMRSVWRPGDSLDATMHAGTHWNRQYGAQGTFRGTDFNTEARYLPWDELATSAGYEYSDNTATLSGSSQVLRAGAIWSKGLFRGATGRLSGDVRRTYLGGGFESSEMTVGYTLDYGIGLVRIALKADAKMIDLSGARDGTDSNSIRLNVVRTF